MSAYLNNWKLLLALSLFLGLAPFFPEPHLVGKFRWVAGGAVGMGAMDWLDLVWHAWPIILLCRLAVLRLRGGRGTS